MMQVNEMLVKLEPKKWRTVRIGTYSSMEEFLQALSSGGFRISPSAADILKKTPLAQAETEIELVLVNPRNLGFTERPRRDEIYNRAQELGLDLLPAEVGPQLRLQYADQLRDELLMIGMDPIADSGRYLREFYVERDEQGHWLGAYWGLPSEVWHLDSLWVFTPHKRD